MTAFNPNLQQEPTDKGDRRTKPVDRRGYQVPVMSQEFANTGGSCSSCGKPLQFWFLYKQCDSCVTISPRSIWQG